MSQPKLQRAVTKNAQFIYELHAQESIRLALGLHRPQTGPYWRNLLQGLYEGYHPFVVSLGVVPIGYICFQDLSKEDRRAELTITITPDMQSKGYGTDVMQQALTKAFAQNKDDGLGLHVVWVGIMSSNKPAHQLLEKTGFEATGHIPNYYRFHGKAYARVIYSKVQITQPPAGLLSKQDESDNRSGEC